MESPQFPDTETLKFGVRVDGHEERMLKYTWVVSQSVIKSGQGSESILVRAKGEERQALTAMVVVCGLPNECPNTISVSLSSHAAPNNGLQRTRR